MSSFTLRAMRDDEWSQVATLIYDSTNAWYVAHGRGPIFSGPKDSTQLFCRVYEALDPGCCVVAVDDATGRIAGSCFYHPRSTHVSLGIMNVSPDYFGQGIARKLLKHITDIADSLNLPTRLVSSAINLDSFSLYNRGGFVPQALYQVMMLTVPDAGVTCDLPQAHRVRPAGMDDVAAMVRLEKAIHGIEREKDFRYFIENADNIWRVCVLPDEADGELAGFLVSVCDPACHMFGPGVMRAEEDAIALIASHLNAYPGHMPAWLVPCECRAMVEQMYRWGAVNMELHVTQCRGSWPAVRGIVMPTFMPETS